jgi:hypothetical protein
MSFRASRKNFSNWELPAPAAVLLAPPRADLLLPLEVFALPLEAFVLLAGFLVFVFGIIQCLNKFIIDD